MALYKKDNIIIEAFKLGVDHIPDWFMDKVTDKTIILKSNVKIENHLEQRSKVWAEVNTSNGVKIINFGDYVVFENNEILSYNPHVFKKIYILESENQYGED